MPSQAPSLFRPQWGSAHVLCHPHPAVPPRITLPPSLPGPVLLNAPVRLTCNATGVPSPTLMWLKDGNPVSTAGTSGLQVSRLGGYCSPPWCLKRCWEQRSGLGAPRREGEAVITQDGRWRDFKLRVWGAWSPETARATDASHPRGRDFSSSCIKMSKKKPFLILHFS